jgi:hypothetical protein
MTAHSYWGEYLSRGLEILNSNSSVMHASYF